MKLTFGCSHMRCSFRPDVLKQKKLTQASLVSFLNFNSQSHCASSWSQREWSRTILGRIC